MPIIHNTEPKPHGSRPLSGWQRPQRSGEAFYEQGLCWGATGELQASIKERSIMKPNRCIFLHCFILLILLALAVCQTSPIGKEYKKSSRNDSSSTLYSARANLTDGIQLRFEAETIAIDGSIIRGKFMTSEYTGQLVQAVYKSICGDAQPYQYCSTAQDLYRYVAYGKKSLELLKGTLSEEVIIREENELNTYLELAKNAPADRPLANIADITNYDQGLVMVNMGGASPAQFQVLTVPRYSIYYSNYQLPRVSNATCSEPLRMTQGDAISIADNVLQKIGIKDEFALVRGQDGTVNHAYYQLFFNDNTKNKAHTLLYLRRVNGNPQLDDSRILLGTDNQYDPSFLQEYILFKIDDNGILSFEWNTPGKLQLTNEPESAISFDDAVSIATNQMKVSYTKYTFKEANPENIRIYINRIALGYIFCKGTGNTADVLPAWEFYGYIADESKPEGADRYYDVNTKNWTDSYENNIGLCVMNALNGNIIDRTGKY